LRNPVAAGFSLRCRGIYQRWTRRLKPAATSVLMPNFIFVLCKAKIIAGSKILKTF